MSDDWKGEHLIRSRPDTKLTTRVVAANMGHKKRRSSGKAAAASAEHSAFVVGAIFRRNRYKDEQRKRAEVQGS